MTCQWHEAHTHPHAHTPTLTHTQHVQQVTPLCAHVPGRLTGSGSSALVYMCALGGDRRLFEANNPPPDLSASPAATASSCLAALTHKPERSALNRIAHTHARKCATTADWGGEKNKDIPLGLKFSHRVLGTVTSSHEPNCLGLTAIIYYRNTFDPL